MEKLLNLLTKTQDELIKEYNIDINEGAVLIRANKVGLRPLLTCHLDTINTHRSFFPLRKEYISVKNNIITLNNLGKEKVACLGGDDRCGLWLVENLKDLNEYDILITTNEEIGGIGVNDWLSFNKEKVKEYSKDWSCIISLDRRSPKGVNEIADYGYGNDELYGFVQNTYNFNIGIGSYTDGVDVARDTGLAMFNLSVGYDNEHSVYEVIYFKALQEILDILKSKEFIDKVSERQYFNDCEVIGDDFDSEFLSYCDFCGDYSYVFDYNDSYICENCLIKLDI